MNRRHFMVSVSAAFAAARGFELARGRALAMPTRAVAAQAPSAPTPSAPTEAQAVGYKAPELASSDSFAFGLVLAGGFRVVQAYEPLHGALPCVLDGEGERVQVDVLRSTQTGTTGVFTTEHFSCFVHGRGGATQERGTRALGLALEQRLAEGVVAPSLASFDERASHASACLHVDFVPVHV